MPPRLAWYVIRALRYEGRNIGKIANSPYEIGHFRLSSFFARMQISRVTSLPVEKTCRGQAASMENFQFFEYLDLNYSALLAD